MTQPNDRDILDWKGNHPAYGEFHFEPVRQDRRTYYRTTGPRLPIMGMTTAKGAREQIVYWQSKGWGA